VHVTVMAVDSSLTTWRRSQYCRPSYSTVNRSETTAMATSSFSVCDRSIRAPDCLKKDRLNSRRRHTYGCRLNSVQSRCVLIVEGCSSFSTDLVRTTPATTVHPSTGPWHHQSSSPSVPSRSSNNTAVQAAVRISVAMDLLYRAIALRYSTIDSPHHHVLTDRTPAHIIVYLSTAEMHIFQYVCLFARHNTFHTCSARNRKASESSYLLERFPLTGLMAC